MFLCGQPNGISLNYIATSIGRAYGAVCQMYRDIMRKVGELPEGKLSGTGETDEGYTRADSKGVSLGSNGENRTVPSRRRLPRGPGRGTFEKNTPMVTILTVTRVYALSLRFYSLPDSLTPALPV